MADNARIQAPNMELMDPIIIRNPINGSIIYRESNFKADINKYMNLNAYDIKLETQCTKYYSENAPDADGSKNYWSFYVRFHIDYCDLYEVNGKSKLLI